MKFSLIIPIYNSETTIKRCIDSVLAQSYSNFEIIAVNDGSTDKTLRIINSYKDERIQVISQENGGLSIARNNGVKRSSGDYLLFLDSDDSIDSKLLEKLNNVITDEDIIRYQIRRIDKDNNENEFHEESFNSISGNEAFAMLSNYKYFELACLYCIKTSYYKYNKFAFEKNRYHEDFGLIPYVIIKASKVTSIDYIGYNYYYTKGSIMDNNSYKKEVKKANDVLWHYQNLVELSSNKYYKSFFANSVLLKCKNLKGTDLQNYKSSIKGLKIYNKLLDNNFKRKLKKLTVKYFLGMYVWVIKWKK